MSYIINKSDGSTLVTLEPGTLDQSTSLYLIGKNYPNYGQLQQENFVHLLENFANSTAPNAPILGQLWYDTANKKLKYYDGKIFKAPGATISETAPTNPQVGDAWWDSYNDQMKAFDGMDWLVVGPLYSKWDTKSGPFVETLFNLDRFPKKVVTNWLNNTRRIIMSDYEFISNVTIAGFPKIYKGYNIAVDAGLPLVAGIDAGNITLTNNNYNANITLNSNVAGTTTNTLTVNGATGEILVTTMPTNNMAVAPKQYVDEQIQYFVYDPQSAIQLELDGLHGNVADLYVNAVSQNTAINSLDLLKAPIDNPSFTGTPLSTTPETTDSSTQIATTAFVKSAIVAADNAKWQGSTKYVSTSLPTGADGIDGDFWFQI